jgi:hypothetical protein
MDGLFSTPSGSANYARDGVPAATAFANEFVFAYDSAGAATRAMANLRTQVAGCQTGSGGFAITDGVPSTAPVGPVEAEWVGAGQLWPYGASTYRIGAARDGNVVVILESYNGWTDRTHRLLEVALLRAIPREYRRLCDLTAPPADACAGVPPGPAVRFTGLPPAGADPSTPIAGQLLASFSDDPRSTFSVYADGRLIWQRWDSTSGSGGPLVVPPGATAADISYVEQRLTPAGARLLRGKVLATGLFTKRRASAPDAWTTLDAGSDRYGTDDIRAGALTGGQYVTIEAVPSANQNPGDNLPAETSADAGALAQIEALFSDPEARLPANAWVDHRLRAYVPSFYTVGFERSAPDPSFLPMAKLPAPIQARLGALFSGECDGVILTTDEVRIVLETFAAADIEPDGTGPTTYSFNLSGRNNRASSLHFDLAAPEDAPDPAGGAACG